jgi:hypothetical protein
MSACTVTGAQATFSPDDLPEDDDDPPDEEDEEELADLSPDDLLSAGLPSDDLPSEDLDEDSPDDEDDSPPVLSLPDFSPAGLAAGAPAEALARLSVL